MGQPTSADAGDSSRTHGPADVGSDQLLQKESPEQCRLDVWTLLDTSRECGTSCSGRNLWGNVVRTSAHSQTPPGSVGPVALEGISSVTFLAKRLPRLAIILGVRSCIDLLRAGSS